MLVALPFWFSVWRAAGEDDVVVVVVLLAHGLGDRLPCLNPVIFKSSLSGNGGGLYEGIGGLVDVILPAESPIFQLF